MVSSVIILMIYGRWKESCGYGHTRLGLAPRDSQVKVLTFCRAMIITGKYGVGGRVDEYLFSLQLREK